jgi:membrane dipeptidase
MLKIFSLKRVEHIMEVYEDFVKKHSVNEKMKEAWEVALKILKPNQRDLKRGLEIHANSIVIDAYGFAPRSAIDGDIVKAAIEEGASNIEIRDMIENMEMTRCVSDPVERIEFISAWEAAGVTCILQNAGEEGQDIRKLIKRLAHFTYVTDMMRDFIQKAVIPDDIVAAKKQNKHCLYLSANGVPLPQDWVSVEEEIRYIEVFFQLGIRMMHLTYNRRNMIGDGCGEPTDGGLSDFGRRVVKEMNRVGVIIDVSHCGWQTSLDAAKYSEKPIVASHTGCYSIHKHYRCKPDHVIEAIAKKGGYIGICCIPRFLGGDIKRMLDHINYIAENFGVDHVAIGTDVAYVSRNATREYEKLPKQPKRRSPWESLWPPDEFETTLEQTLSMAWTNWPLFTVGLIQLGYSEEDVRKIIGGNVLRVAQSVLN